MIQIKATNLSIGYNFHSIFKKINFTIEYGDFVCLVGGNGVGKSTLIKTILGLYPAISGKIHYDKNTKLESIGYLPQRLEISNDFPASVYEVVLSGCLNKLKWKPFYTKKEKALVNRNMKLLGIDKIKHKSFKELSGGQMQRVLIARAICATNKLIILDEPFVALDKKMVNQLEDTIRKINKELGVTILIVTHNFNTIHNITNKVIELSTEGCKSFTKEEYLKKIGEQ